MKSTTTLMDDGTICDGVSSPRKSPTSRKGREKWGTPIIYDAGEVGHPAPAGSVEEQRGVCRCYGPVRRENVAVKASVYRATQGLFAWLSVHEILHHVR